MSNFYTESLPRQQLKITCVAGVEEIKGTTLDCVVSPTSKAFPESRPHRVMSSAARHDTVRQHRRTCSIASVYSDSRKRPQRLHYDSRQWTSLCVLLTDCDQLCRCGEARHVTKLPRDAAPIVCADAKV